VRRSASGLDTEAVRWSRAPLAFELVSSDPGILQRAGVVFGPWMAAATGDPCRRWVVESRAEDEWCLTGPGVERPIRAATRADVVRAVEALAVGELIACRAATTLHAALVARGERGIVILGAPETGKSTLAVALWRRGWTVLGDDLAVVDPLGAIAWSGPRRVSLRSASRPLVGDDVWRRIGETRAADVTEEGYLFHPDDVDARPGHRRVRLAALVFLGRRDVSPAPGLASALPAALALLAVLPYSNVIRRTDAGTAIRHFRPLVTTVPAYDLARGGLDTMASTMERILSGPSR
jgi:hypothetical protein